MNIQKVSKIVLAILLFLCIAPMPYGYFQLVRVLSMIAFAYFEIIKKNEITGIIFIALAILFQPFIKIALGRFLWNIVDIVVGVGLLIYAFNSLNTNKDKK